MTRKCIDSLFKELFDETINEDQFVHNVKLMKTSNRQKEFRMLMKTLLSEFRNYSTFPNLQVGSAIHVNWLLIEFLKEFEVGIFKAEFMKSLKAFIYLWRNHDVFGFPEIKNRGWDFI